jgi:hypothetical protein
MKTRNRVLSGLSIAMFGMMAFASQAFSGIIEVGPAPGNGTTVEPFNGC